MRARIAVTGMGVVSSVGLDVPTYWRALLAGQSGVTSIEDFSIEKLRSDVAASVRGFDPSRFLDPKELTIWGRVAQFAVAASSEAVSQAKLESVDRTRMGVLVSTGQGAVEILEEQILRARDRGPKAVSPYFIPSVMPNAVSALVSMKFGCMGPSFNVASACATSSHALVVSALMLQAGEADVMLAGGAEAATRMSVVAGFGNARALARSYEGNPARASRPYDKHRHGFVMGEGAGALVLETEEHARQRGAPILGYLIGWGMSTDAHHVTRPESDGRGLSMAIERALRRAALSPSEIGYINPHATSTLQGDWAEYLALRRVFGDQLRRIPISATKSMVGHLLGAAGAAEAIAVVCSLRDQSLHPSINVDELDEGFDLDLVRERRAVDFRYALSNSAGFGGHNCVLAFERA